VSGLETAGGVTCVKLVGRQQSLDWDEPRADQTAWRRRDTVWINPQLGVAERVERVVERRDPARRDPTHRLSVTYALTSRLRYPGRLLDDRKQEILKAKRFHDDAAMFLKQPAQFPAQLDALVKKVSHHIEHQPPTPYRKAVFHLASRIDSARRGDTPPEPVADDLRPIGAVRLGQRVPDFVVSDLLGRPSTRLSRLLGKPILVCFFDPASATGVEVMRFVRGLSEKHGDELAVMAMAVTADAELARRLHRDLRLQFTILDGKAMRLTFGVDATPRQVLLDGAGHVRYAVTGWGPHVPREVQEELERWLPK
jgi:peroxiredoxin